MPSKDSAPHRRGSGPAHRGQVDQTLAPSPSHVTNACCRPWLASHRLQLRATGDDCARAPPSDGEGRQAHRHPRALRAPAPTIRTLTPSSAGPPTSCSSSPRDLACSGPVNARYFRHIPSAMRHCGRWSLLFLGRRQLSDAPGVVTVPMVRFQRRSPPVPRTSTATAAGGRPYSGHRHRTDRHAPFRATERIRTSRSAQASGAARFTPVSAASSRPPASPPRTGGARRSWPTILTHAAWCARRPPPCGACCCGGPGGELRLRLYDTRRAAHPRFAAWCAPPTIALVVITNSPR